MNSVNAVSPIIGVRNVFKDYLFNFKALKWGKKLAKGQPEENLNFPDYYSQITGLSRTN